jgi:hypothetical protein
MHMHGHTNNKLNFFQNFQFCKILVLNFFWLPQFYFNVTAYFPSSQQNRDPNPRPKCPSAEVFELLNNDSKTKFGTPSEQF